MQGEPNWEKGREREGGKHRTARHGSAASRRATAGTVWTRSTAFASHCPHQLPQRCPIWTQALQAHPGDQSEALRLAVSAAELVAATVVLPAACDDVAPRQAATLFCPAAA